MKQEIPYGVKWLSSCLSVSALKVTTKSFIEWQREMFSSAENSFQAINKTEVWSADKSTSFLVWKGSAPISLQSLTPIAHLSGLLRCRCGCMTKSVQIHHRGPVSAVVSLGTRCMSYTQHMMHQIEAVPLSLLKQNHSFPDPTCSYLQHYYTLLLEWKKQQSKIKITAKFLKQPPCKTYFYSCLLLLTATS